MIIENIECDEREKTKMTASIIHAMLTTGDIIMIIILNKSFGTS